MKTEQLKQLKSSGAFENIDLVFAEFLLKTAGQKDNPLLFAAAALASRAVRSGHSCCDLRLLAETSFPEELPPGAAGTVRLPPLGEWLDALRVPSLRRWVALPPETPPGSAPLVLDSEGRLYLNRYYVYESRIVRELRKRCGQTKNLPDLAPGKLASLSPYFRQGEPGGTTDFQQLAVFLARSSAFSVITGGPGTGKTTVVTALLALELEQNPTLEIFLCAPTGKAQARMKDSIVSGVRNLECAPALRERLLSIPCRTIHSLLRPKRFTTRYFYNEENPLPADLVVVDEASMISLPLMANLFAALRPDARILLLGDKNQLASVEAGSVLSDLCASGCANVLPPDLAEPFRRQTSWQVPTVSDDRPLSGHIAELKVNYRSKDAPVISSVAEDIRALEDGKPVEELSRRIAALAVPEFTTLPLPPPAKLDEMLVRIFFARTLEAGSRPGEKFAPAEMVAAASEGTMESLNLAFELLDSFRILCAVRNGPWGVENINSILRSQLGMTTPFAPGMPVMILRNTPELDLYNGDVGLVWKNPESGRLCAAFRDTRENAVLPFRFLSAAELPENETVFAMTIHKSQGSGFRNVLTILPDRASPVLTRELVYTAITRAERVVTLWSDPGILEQALRTPTVRHSGLASHLAEEPR